MSELLLSTSALTKQFGRHKAVDQVSMHIKRGAIYGFIGRNGAGKTTTLRMIGGLASPTAGEIEMFGCRGRELKQIRSRVGCLIEGPGLYGNMTARDNMKMKCLLLGVQKKGYIEELLEVVGLKDVGKKHVKRYSLGMKQRLMLAQAIMEQPDVLLLDEPTNAIDKKGVELVHQIMSEEASRGAIVLLASHVDYDIRSLCSKVF